MNASDILRENVNELMKERGWTSNKPLIAASEKRLTNGTLGRIRGDGENTKLSQVEELAAVFGVTPAAMLAPGLSVSVSAPSLKAAVARLAQALALDMPDEVREDAGEMLGKLAKRRGGTPDLVGQLVSLLATVERSEVIPTQLGGRLDLDHAMSHQPIEHAHTPQILGVDQLHRDRGREWDMSNVGAPADVARPRAGASRQHKPGEKPAAKSSKRAKP